MQRINVNKPYLPDKNKYFKYLDKIWENNHLTNFGPLSLELENRLCEFLGVDNILFLANGTLALQVAYKLAGLKAKDKILTTPFSFVATTDTVMWENIEPIFCDINAKSLCIDEILLDSMLTKSSVESKIESNIDSQITHNIKAILPVHTFGNTCDLEKLEQIAKKHHLKIIYDAAHAFGVKYKNKSVFSYGDISTISFHATKIFHSIEGGAIIFRDKSLKDEAKSIINFGLKNNMPEVLGINAKNSEFHAAMGLCVLDDMHYILEDRKRVWEYYFKHLKDIFEFQILNPNINNNYHYFPILCESEESLLEKIRILNSNNIFPRRYFYPSLDTLSFYNKSNAKSCKISQDIASRILCLPIYVGLEQESQDKIIKCLIS
ncbi:aminotransferase DegT [Helicobacter sp. 16-1353]|uniref:DegT/DnrJ/EryC1/StrS family aminotransferase n=1 Tax=Helicobacter sp. 16-1353 TaxID=2004996 RepID=UPI000DCBDF7D|nr:DegT/DnrJ/EryC1/StrS family aminotransferase [Helicobacter sp. 16-1353]RAX51908.1 aminotransferase DegT [Helicobacter sp. 16-1353]